jgi:hypothetical protein
MALDIPDAERAARFVSAAEARIAAMAGPEEAEACQVAISLDHCWAGLARYWQRKRSVHA